MDIRAAEPTDIEEIESLRMQAFLPVYRAAFGRRAPDAILQTLIDLRRQRHEPVAGEWVATDDSRLIAVLTGRLAEMNTRTRGSRLRPLMSLGLLGLTRFLIVSQLVYNRYQPASHEVYLSGTVVHPAWRRRGVAYALTQYAQEQARRAGKSLACAFVMPDNFASRSVLEKLGWRETGVQRSFWRGLLLKESDSIRYEKYLDNCSGAWHLD